MKKTLIVALFICIAAPSMAHAAWWNPFSWKATIRAEGATTTAEAPVLDTSLVPTIHDLNLRISELEDKLQKALSENMALKLKIQFAESQNASSKESQKNESATSKSAVAVTSSEKDIAAKVRSALVLVETATSSSSGVIIDAAGHILVPAHAIWLEAPDKTVTGAIEQVSVTLSSGAKRTARLVGLNELSDAAVLKIVEKGPYPFVSLGAQASAKQGDRAFVTGAPGTKGGTGGEAFIPGAVSKVNTGSIEVAIDKKPLDNGGAIFDASGAFIGIPNKSTCKVLEEMKICLKYSVTSNTLRGTLTQIMEGMRLYKDKISNKTETLVRGQLESVYRGTKESTTISYAVSNVTGENSFDFINSRLGEDQKGKITRLYLTKLKTAATNIYSAIDVFKNQAEALRVFLINEEVAISGLGSYQRKVLEKIEADNQNKLKEYRDLAALWSKKKNEDDAHLVDPSNANHDYLMTEGIFVEEAAEYLTSERSEILDTYSGETVDIF